MVQVGGYRYAHGNMRGYPGAAMGAGGQCGVVRHDQQRNHPASTFPSMNLQGELIRNVFTLPSFHMSSHKTCARKNNLLNDWTA